MSIFVPELLQVSFAASFVQVHDCLFLGWGWINVGQKEKRSRTTPSPSLTLLLPTLTPDMFLWCIRVWECSFLLFLFRKNKNTNIKNKTVLFSHLLGLLILKLSVEFGVRKSRFLYTSWCCLVLILVHCSQGLHWMVIVACWGFPCWSQGCHDSTSPRPPGVADGTALHSYSS